MPHRHRREVSHASAPVGPARVDVLTARSDTARGGTLVVTGRRDGPAGWDQDTAFARAVLSQDGIAVAELDMDLRVVRANAAYDALRHAGGPIVLRLIRDRVLVCEVSDPSNTQPRLRRALNTEEEGRGLFLVAQLSTRWGCRYGPRGKTIWTEQALAPSLPPRPGP